MGSCKKYMSVIFLKEGKVGILPPKLGHDETAFSQPLYSAVQ